MDYYELYQENPGLLVLVLIISIVLTLFVYGAFPIIFAKTRKTPITKKKYKRLCYGINVIGFVLFAIIDGAAQVGPYLLWTWIFSSAGVKTLENKGLFLETEPKKDKNPEADDAIKSILKMQAQNTIEAMETNSKTQPDNENDADFGLVPHKPIFTLALDSVDGEEEYLNKLYTVNGEKIKYSRSGSMSVAGVNGMIDVYKTFLPSGEPYKTIYINMYGATKSTKAPEGFVLKGNTNYVPERYYPKKTTPIKTEQSEKMPKKKKDVLKIILAILCPILIAAVIALSITLVISLDNYQQVIDELYDKNNRLQIKLDGKEESLKTANSKLAGVYDELDAQKELTRKEYAEAEKWKNLYMNGGETKPNDTTFNSVTELLSAIKSNASYYNNKEVIVYGTMAKYGTIVHIVNSTVMNGTYINTYENDAISVKISNDLQYTVVETGDLVKIAGKVVIKNNEIYLNKCNCEIITAYKDR